MSTTTQMSARDRILALLDANSFVEIGALVTKRNTDFNLQGKEAPSDGVITGYGVIHGRLAYVYGQDVSVMNGTMGEMHAKKIMALYDLALKVGAPVVGFVDCAGLRLQEATDALAAFGGIYLKQAQASGIIPQITAVVGSCGGGSAVLASMSDFVFMEEKNGKLFVNAPNTLDGNNAGKCDTAAAGYMAAKGVADFVYGTDEALVEGIRELMSVLPYNNAEEAAGETDTDDLNRTLDNLTAELSDTTLALSDISDNGLFVEVKKDYAKEMVTGFIRLNGMTIGAVANRTAELSENGKTVAKFEDRLTTAGCYKAESFVKFCDAFGIPLLTLTNVSGYAATVPEAAGIGIAAAKLTYAFASATVPKINVVTEKAYGSAYITMNSKHIGADLVYALEDAKIGTMDADLAVQIMYAEELKGADAAGLKVEKAKEYDALSQSALAAAKRGYVDAVLTPGALRKHLLYGFEMLFTKRESLPGKKHGTV
ncbi:MAG: carboxyl transferase [Lachnospiraceae bacterium]|nr:carboxyl transferase [Lachnospiraceae bacterium]